MQRTPEPELMNGADQVQAYAGADFSSSDQALVDGLQAFCERIGSELKAGDCVVDLGCGPGNISERLARHWPDCDVIGMDAAPRMLLLAEQRRQQDPVRLGRLRYEQRSLKSINAPAGAAVIVSNSLLHHLHEPMDLWRAQRRLGRSGSLVFHRDLRRPDSPEQAWELRERHLASAPDVLRADYLASLHAAFTLTEVETQLAAAGLAALDVVPVEDRYLEIRGRLP